MRLATPLVLACSLAFAGCDNLLDITDPDRVFAFDVTFEGTLEPNGHQTHDFTVSRDGEVLVTLQNAGPPGIGTIVNMGVGVPAGDVCNLIIEQTLHVDQVPVLGGPATAGPLCVEISDDGRLTESVAYRIRVQHP